MSEDFSVRCLQDFEVTFPNYALLKVARLRFQSDTSLKLLHWLYLTIQTDHCC
jgi:hypothetical protein